MTNSLVLAVYVGHCRVGGGIPYNPLQAFVDVAAEMESRHGFLPKVTALRVGHGSQVV